MTDGATIDALLARLAAVGGESTGRGPSRWGSYEIITPVEAAEKYLWCTPAALTDLLDEWEAAHTHGRAGLLLQRIADAMRGTADAPQDS